MENISFLFRNVPALMVVGLMLLLGLLARHIVVADARFSHAYLVYAVAADDADTAAYVPTATNNPVRFEINQVLAQILGGNMSDEKRLLEAKRGLDLTHIAKDQVDGMSENLETVDHAIDGMEQALFPGDALFQRGDPQKIIAFAKEKQAAIKDIQALSYRANFETERIFQHIVDAKGKLATAYIQDLNDQLPSTQQEFDKRQERYRDMQALFAKIRLTYTDFTSITQAKH